MIIFAALLAPGVAAASYVQALPAIPSINLSFYKFINGAYYQSFSTNSMSLVEIDVTSNSSINVYLIPLNELNNYSHASRLMVYFSGSGSHVAGSVVLSNGSYAVLMQADGQVESRSFVYEAVNPLEAVRANMPMGVADYGVACSNGSLTSYEYNATGFVGVVKIVTAESSGYGVQLNANMILNGSTYFIQDELAYYHGKFMSVINIWNESGPQLSAPLVSEGDYLFGSHVLGNSSLPLNARLFEEVEGNESSHYLVIGVNSSIGDWEVSTRLPGDAWFMVDGGQLTPFGNLYDAELVVGGFGNSSIAEFTAVSINLSLFIINGTRTLRPPSAWSFGVDTMEGAANISSTWAGNSSIISMGAPSLMQLYTTVTPPAIPMSEAPLLGGNSLGLSLVNLARYRTYIEVVAAVMLLWAASTLIGRKRRP